MKRIFSFSVLGLTCLLGLVYYFYPKNNLTALTPLPTEVKTAFVVLKDAPDIIKATANTLNMDQVDISPETAGTIKAIQFKAGQLVKKGQVLIDLDDETYQKDADSAKAALSLSRLNYQRTLSLSKKQLSSVQSVDEAKVDLQNKENALKVKTNALNKMHLKAPFSGRITEKNISPGAYVAPGQSLLTLIDNQTLKIQYRVPARFLPELKQNQTVTLRTSLYPEKTFEAYVTYISPNIEPDTRTLLVEAQFDNHEQKLRSGVFLTINHMLGNTHLRRLVPEESLIPTITGEKIYVVKGNKAKSVNVKTGQHINGLVEITEGLKDKDEIVFRGQHKLHDGSLIKRTQATT
jgi:membrane fusion protein (multidrug efflux system)